jgi:hypothetical protein
MSPTLATTESSFSGHHFNSPGGVHVGDDGKIYVADTQNNRVVRITRASLSVGRPENSSAPLDVALDVGADGTVDWGMAGPLAGNATAGGPSLAAAFTAALANLTGTPDAYGNPMATVPVDLFNGGRGNLSVTGIWIEYDCALELDNIHAAVRTYIMGHPANGTVDVLVPLAFTASSAGGIMLSGLNITGDFPPRLLAPVPDLAMEEGTAQGSLCDLAAYFSDELDAGLNFSVADVSNSSIAAVTIVNRSLLSVDCWPPPPPPGVRRVLKSGPPPP